MSRLLEIFARKRGEVEAAKAAVPITELHRLVLDAPPVRPFKGALENSCHDLALIAEVKKASPSLGLIRAEFDPAEVAVAYRDAGADCLSVLTDHHYFQGCLQNLTIARSISGLPCLRKDFIFDPYQIVEARAWGADCILLIVAGLAEPTLAQLWNKGKELGMDVLVEVHSRAEVEIALELGADFIGVNNRDLANFRTTLAISDELLPLVRNSALCVSESALESRQDLLRVRRAGARAVLIGTAFCAAPDIAVKVREVMGW